MKKKRLFLLLAFMTAALCSCGSGTLKEDYMEASKSSEEIVEVTETPSELTENPVEITEKASEITENPTR